MDCLKRFSDILTDLPNWHWNQWLRFLVTMQKKYRSLLELWEPHACAPSPASLAAQLPEMAFTLQDLLCQLYLCVYSLIVLNVFVWHPCRFGVVACLLQSCLGLARPPHVSSLPESWLEETATWKRYLKKEHIISYKDCRFYMIFQPLLWLFFLLLGLPCRLQSQKLTNLCFDGGYSWVGKYLCQFWLSQVALG